MLLSVECSGVILAGNALVLHGSLRKSKRTFSTVCMRLEEAWQ